MNKFWPSWAPQSWADQLDFVGPRVRTAPWAWAILLCGLMACIWVWSCVSRVDADLADAQQVVKRLQRAAHQERVNSMARLQAGKGGSAVPALSPDGARHVAQLAQSLSYPWLSVLEQVEVTARAEQVVMLSFNLDLAALATQAQAAPEVRVAAAIKDDDAALRWTHAQGPSAQLLNLERLAAPFVTALGRYDWRAQASWPGVQP